MTLNIMSIRIAGNNGAKMYIAMNRFKILPGREVQFEEIWRGRNSHLDDVPGFIQFHLIRGAESDSHILYASHSLWESQDSFSNWTKSEAFRHAHKNAGQHQDLYIGHPEFEGFEIVI